MTLLACLRLAAIAGIVAAIADPGCPQPRRLLLAVEGTASTEPAAIARVRDAVVRASRTWGDVLGDNGGARADGRLVVGDAAAVIERLDRVPAALAVRPSGPALAIAAIGAPMRAGVGARVAFVVDVDGMPGGPGELTLTIEDRESGREQARESQEVAAAGRRRVVVPWLAAHPGTRTLRLRAQYRGAVLVRDARADARIQVVPPALSVATLEARPSWAVRFARLALAEVPNLRLATEVRTAPGLTVRSEQGARAEAEVILVGGPEALMARDVSSLERAVRERGRTVVLVLDEVPRGGAWRRLWPGSLGPASAAARPRVVDLGGHRWNVREWMTPPLSTQVRALAYSDSGSPVIVGRGLGAGRVVLVAALDAWRWRADDGVEWASGWQALVRRLAADVPPPIAVAAWAGGEGRRRIVQADVRLRPDVSPAAGVRATLPGASAASGAAFPLWPAGPGRWRGAVPAPADGPVALNVVATVGGTVVPSSPVVVDVSAPIAPATWRDVVQAQAARGAGAVEEADLGPALARWQQAREVPPGERWYATRHWAFAALVLGALGSEWMLRRVRRLP